jgi:hypothetical protein
MVRAIAIGFAMMSLFSCRTLTDIRFVRVSDTELRYKGRSIQLSDTTINEVSIQKTEEPNASFSIVAISPWQDFDEYWIKGLRMTIHFVDTTNAHQIGDRFELKRK